MALADKQATAARTTRPERAVAERALAAADDCKQHGVIGIAGTHGCVEGALP